MREGFERKRIRTTVFRCVAIAGIASLLALPAWQVGAQDATPTEGGTPTAVVANDPANCTTAPLSTDHAAMLMATPVAQPEPTVTDAGIVALPEGQAVTADQEAAVMATLEQLWSCNNARNKAAVFALFTDEGLQETIGFTDGASWDSADLRANVASALTRGEPRTSDELASIDAIVSMQAYDDGQVGVLVLNSDPYVADGAEVLDYFRFEITDGVAMVTQVILDPYDLTPGYGFEKDA